MRIFKKNSKKIQAELPTEIHKHPFVVPVVTFFILFFVGCAAFINFSGGTVGADETKVVRVYVDGDKHVFPTHAPTVGELLKRLNIELAPEDVVEPNINSPILSDNFSVNVYRARPVTVVDEDGTRIIDKIAESTAPEIAKKAGLKIFPEDKVEFAAPDLAIADKVVGDLITIDRAVPIILNLYGKDLPIRTQAKTVGELIPEKSINLNQGDTLTPKAETPIKKGMRVFVLGEGKRIVTEEEKIPAPVETEYDATMKVGETKVVDPGKDGKRVVTYEINIEKGKVTSRKEIQSIITEQPEVRKVIEGTKSEGFGGGFDAALASLRSCEGSYSSMTGNGYYGAYQFNSSSWRSFAPEPYKSYWDQGKVPPPAAQDQAARNYYEVSGWSPWPACSVSLGLQDVYR